MDLARLELACGSPIEMLDGLAQSWGSFTAQLERFYCDANLQSTR